MIPKFKVAIRKGVLLADKTANLKIRVSHQNKTRYISTDYYVIPKYFDKKTGIIKIGGPYSKNDADHINGKLQIQIGIMADKAEKQRNINFMDIGSLMKILRDKHREIDFFALIDDRIENCRKLGNHNYKDSFKSTKTIVENFYGASILPFETIDYSFLMKLENSLKYRDFMPNSIGIFMRNIRTIYNQAITMGIVDLSLYPFRKYKIPKGRPRHRTLSPTEMATIAKIEIKDPLMRWARDMFMLSFCLIGINMKDLMYLEKIEGGRINYIRSKGKKNYSIKVPPQALHIIKRYPGKRYLLNTLDKYSDYRTATKRINYKLKDIAKICKIDKEVSTYYCRHSWGTLARTYLNISKDDIAAALGHRQIEIPETTEGYIEEDQRMVDLANKKVIRLILRTPPKELHQGSRQSSE
jgi:integrase